MDLEALSAFSLVAAHGGITQASRSSGRPKASLSRQVMELEASLGVRLFDRGSRSIHLTEEGELLQARTAGPLSEIAEAAELLRDGLPCPRGRLRINVPTLFGEILMGRLAGEFAQAYPDVTLEVAIDDRMIDPVVEGFDIVVRANPRPESTLIGCCFAKDCLIVVSSPSVCPPWNADQQERTEVPVVTRSPATNQSTWCITRNGQDHTMSIKPVLQLPSFLMVRDAAITGIGAAQLPHVLVAEDLSAGRLTEWGYIAGAPSELWALHVSKRYASAKVKAFMRVLKTAFPTGWLSREF